MDGLIKLVSFVTIVIFLPGQTVLGRGCYRDPKIYTVKVAAESQHVLILKAMIKCLNSTAPLDEKLKGQYCPSVFDNLMCWPHTRAGIVLQQNCPDYINNFNTQEKARRECLFNGTWFIHPETNATWTDFTQCMRPYNPTDPLMEDLPKIERLNMIGYSVSLTFLSVAVVVMLSLKRLHCQRNYIHINLFVSFVLRSIICLVKDVFHTPDGDTRVINNTVTLTTLGSNWPCKLLFSIFNYIIVANYTWIFLEGLFLHNIIFVTTFKNSKRFFMYIIFGWCSPLLCIIPWVIVRRLLEDTL
ncbi:parathyroid hormone 2 receptor-like [Saccostrea cucullata]|uniref:parathyroid hormone 2 receptor-like n=1 Tax=Saccostrea cuccullata TaxID=36930 RepID=UPI002ED36BD1